MAHVLAPYIIRTKDGKVHRYWCLVRSVRVGRRVIQQTAAQPDERVRIEARALARRLIGAPEEAPLFDDSSGQLTAPVRLKGVRVERSRRFGDVYLPLALWRGLGLEELCPSARTALTRRRLRLRPKGEPLCFPWRQRAEEIHRRSPSHATG